MNYIGFESFFSEKSNATPTISFQFLFIETFSSFDWFLISGLNFKSNKIHLASKFVLI